MNIQSTYEYQLIQQVYGTQTAERSKVPLLNHIDEGLLILDLIKASLVAQQAYCLHPVFQSDEALSQNCSYLTDPSIDRMALALTFEYRNIANQYLSKRSILDISEINLSPLAEVNHLLIADKVQNRKDFELYHQYTHPRSKELTQYFNNWLRRLGVSETDYSQYVTLLKSQA
jgi:hypothetical protein